MAPKLTSNPLKYHPTNPFLKQVTAIHRSLKMAIDQSTISLSADAQTKKAAYGEIYCSTQGTCPNGWQIKLAENYPLAQSTTSPSADTLTAQEKVPDMQAVAPVPEAELKHNGERSGIHGTAIIAAVTGQHIADPSPQMRAAHRKARLNTLRKKHVAAKPHHHEHHHQVVTRANGHHKRNAKAAHHYRTAKALPSHHKTLQVAIPAPERMVETAPPPRDPFREFLMACARFARAIRT
jgi:hypothetical protein